jgi:hypothetical protein
VAGGVLGVTAASVREASDEERKRLHRVGDRPIVSTFTLADGSAVEVAARAEDRHRLLGSSRLQRADGRDDQYTGGVGMANFPTTPEKRPRIRSIHTRRRSPPSGSCAGGDVEAGLPDPAADGLTLEETSSNVRHPLGDEIEVDRRRLPVRVRSQFADAGPWISTIGRPRARPRTTPTFRAAKSAKPGCGRPVGTGPESSTRATAESPSPCMAAVAARPCVS